MPLKIHSPDIHEHPQNHTHITPPLYHLYYKHLPLQEQIEKLGHWITEITMVDTLEDCDMVMPATEINQYFIRNRQSFLYEVNQQATAAGKLMVCWTSNDYGITPRFTHFHLFRSGGYVSRNKGNEFLSPVFIPDPVAKFYDGQLHVHHQKTAKPLVGFCGQGQTSTKKMLREIALNLYRLVQKKLGRWIYDTEKVMSTTTIRSRILDTLEQSPLVDTLFIRHSRYRAGAVTKEQKEESSKRYFTNMHDATYIVCYRGNGNFSVRLYETLAMGRIPFIVTSDNNLPWPELVDWQLFPTIADTDYKKAPQVLYAFHESLSDETFAGLQQQARSIFDAYISYPGFMQTFVDQYTRLLSK
jgi:hypothetical protein